MKTNTVLKKNGTTEQYNFEKIVKAVGASADRAGVKLTPKDLARLQEEVESMLVRPTVTVTRLHNVVEMSLIKVSKEVANSYIGYRNHKKDAARLLGTIKEGTEKALNERDRSNSNLNSVLNSAKRVKLSEPVLRAFYSEYHLDAAERQAIADGSIYVHDMDARMVGSHNCCVVDPSVWLDGGFTSNNFYCKEPKNIISGVRTTSDLLISFANQQYGGASFADIDKVWAKYCEKSYVAYLEEAKKDFGISGKKAEEWAKKKTLKDLKDSIQAFELQMVTRETTRGDYVFATLSFGKYTGKWGDEIVKTILEVRREGHGDKVKQVAIFPKLVYRADNVETKPDIFDEVIKTQKKAMYPDIIPEDTVTPMG